MPAGGLVRAVGRTFDAELEERRGFLWAAAAFAGGAALWFALPFEPPPLPLASVAAILALAAIIGWQRDLPFRRLLVLLAALVAGLLAATLRVATVATPAIEATSIADVAGRVRSAERREGPSLRLVLDRLAIEGLAPERTPARLRLTLRGEAPLPPIGARVSLRARLVPLPPAIPGGYDFRRAAFFDRLGGTGIVIGPLAVLPLPPDRDALPLRLADLRARLTARYQGEVPGDAGAIAAALLVGERSAISAAADEALRASGLSHVLSISGLHMVLIAGTAYSATRLLLALVPGLALRFRLERWAALVGLAAATAYLGLSGGGAATTRAFVMAAIGFLAILAGRPAISMRNLALALLVTVALEPEGVVEPGFQMSFAAVAALVAGFEWWRDRDRPRLAEPVRSWPLRLGLWLLKALAVTLVTTLLAGLATAPYASHHFGRLAPLSLLGNLLAMPVVSLVIMPAGLIALVLSPFGLEAPALLLMGLGIEAMLAIARFVAALPGALVALPPLPSPSLLLATAGLLWLTLWQRPWRVAGFAPLLLAPAFAPLLVQKPDLIVSGDGRTVAVRRADGGLSVAGGRPDSFAMKQWFERDGLSLPAPERLRDGVLCDPDACLVTLPDGRAVSLVRRFEAFAEDCSRVAVVVSPLVAPANCRAPLILDRARLAGGGTTIVDLTEGAPSLRSVAASTPRRFPWGEVLPIVRDDPTATTRRTTDVQDASR